MFKLFMLTPKDTKFVSSACLRTPHTAIVSSREQSPRFYTYVYTRKTWRKIKIIVALLVDDTQEDKTITILLTDRFRLNFNVYNYIILLSVSFV